MKTVVLPDVFSNDTCYRPDVVRILTEWVMLSSFSQTSSNAREVAFTDSAHVPDIVALGNTTPPTSPQNVKKPAEDNFEVQGILRKSEEMTTKANDHESVVPINNVFCLAGPPKCGKTQLAAKLCESLAQMKCLGGYFSFDGSSQTMLQDLDALTMTLIHQMSIAEPDSVGFFKKALTSYGRTLYHPLEQRFESLFVEPIKDFMTGRSQGKVKVTDPLIFVIDGLGTDDLNGDIDEAKTMAKKFVDWICSTGIGRLPRHIKFIVLMRSNTSVARLLKEKGLHGFEMSPIVHAVEEVTEVVNGSYEKWAANTSMVSSPIRANSC